MTASPPSVLPDERLAAERLDALAHTQAITDKALPRVLFVCSHNAGRSQMAAALLGLRAGGRVTVSSAGTDPAAEVEPEAAQVLHDAGVALEDASPKLLTDEVIQAADIVVTMGCGDACPVVPGRRYLDWPVADPDGARSPLSGPSATRSTPTSPSCSPPSRAPELPPSASLA
ncbi:arsenate reductase/protein-tyrosine-phosphatase family protein [Streptomyces rhizosphaericus]|uniref:arsenate reductase/protein-tyrosine-phosphatase family protein n=1 Tax=Streptomyces rhizosphaericus TaxID=114699 RepID=UPI002030291D|nr:arsenate reductase ArsC [Streptomyces rhizosphaericus]